MLLSTLPRRGSFLSLIALVVILAATLTAPVNAQLNAQQWILGFDVGNANVDSSGEDFDLDLRGSLRGSYMITDLFELELQLMRAEAPLDAVLNAAMVNGVFNFRSDQTIVPYLLLGLGYYDLNDYSFLGLGPDVDEQDSGYQVAIGSRFFVGQERRMAVRLEASSLWLDSDLFDQDQHTSVTAGLSWTLGQR